MTCDETREQFSAWVDRALSPAERAEVAAHLAACAECPRELDRFARTVELLGRVELPRAPVGFVDRVMTAVRPEPWPRRALRALVGARPQVPVSIAATAAIAALSVYLYQSVPELQQATRLEAPRVERIEPLTPVPVEPGPVERPVGSGPAPPHPSTFRSPGSSGPPATPRPPAASAPPAAGEDPRLSLRRSGEGARKPAPSSRSQVEPDAARRAPAEPAPTPPGTSASPAPPPAPAAPPAPSESADARVRQDRGPDPSPPAGSAPLAARRLPPPTAPPAVAKEQGYSAASAPLPAPRPPDLAGQLAVADRAAALGALDRLAADVGAATLGRLQDGDTIVVDLLVPRAAYDRLEPGLRAIGAWTRDTARAPVPEMVQVSVRVTPLRR